jgi:hypothetical protein
VLLGGVMFGDECLVGIDFVDLQFDLADFRFEQHSNCLCLNLSAACVANDIVLNARSRVAPRTRDAAVSAKLRSSWSGWISS